MHFLKLCCTFFFVYTIKYIIKCIYYYNLQRPLLMGISDTLSDVAMTRIEKTFEILDGYLKDSQFVAGNELTIADFAIASSVSCAKVFILVALMVSYNNYIR
jgi:glutathione S-transferase